MDHYRGQPTTAERHSLLSRERTADIPPLADMLRLPQTALRGSFPANQASRTTRPEQLLKTNLSSNTSSSQARYSPILPAFTSKTRTSPHKPADQSVPTPSSFNTSILINSFPRRNNRCKPAGYTAWFDSETGTTSSGFSSTSHTGRDSTCVRNCARPHSSGETNCDSCNTHHNSENTQRTGSIRPPLAGVNRMHKFEMCDLKIPFLKLTSTSGTDKENLHTQIRKDTHHQRPQQLGQSTKDIPTIGTNSAQNTRPAASAAATSSDIEMAAKLQKKKQPTPSFYRRPLPSQLVSFTSDEGKQLFKESVQDGTAEIFFNLSGNFVMQSEPAFCGLGSLAIILNALSVDPGKRWKGVWRWYSDDMLECCPPLEVIRKDGITFDELASVARCNGLEVVPKRGDRVSREEFMRDLERVTRSSNEHMVISFSRKSLGQTGEGHFSPVGAYHKESNKMLVLDTARFKYPSYFCDADQLYDAFQPADPTTGKARGYMLLKNGGTNPHPLTRLDSVENLRRIMLERLPKLMKEKQPIELSQFVKEFGELLEENRESIPLTFVPPGVDLAAQQNQTDGDHYSEMELLHLNCIEQVKRALRDVFPDVAENLECKEHECSHSFTATKTHFGNLARHGDEEIHCPSLWSSKELSVEEEYCDEEHEVPQQETNKLTTKQNTCKEERNLLAFLFILGIPEQLMRELDSVFLYEEWDMAVKKALSNERLLEKEVHQIKNQLEEILGLSKK